MPPSMLLAATARDPHPDADFVVQGAAAELAARRYDRARGLLVGQPWLEDYDDGAALAVLGDAEAHLGRFAEAATHFTEARRRTRGSTAALRAVHAGLAWEQPRRTRFGGASVRGRTSRLRPAGD